MVRSAAGMRAVVDGSPFPPADHDPAKLTVTFLSGPLDPERLTDRLDASTYAPDEFRLGEREIYAYFPNGLGRSKLAPVLSKGVLERLQICPETLSLLERKGLPAHVLPTEAAVRLYNELAATQKVGGLFHSTC